MSATDLNREYYEDMTPGREDYWRKMAAPRHRVECITTLIRQLAPTSVVDLGCGNGVLLSELHGALPGVRFSGLDLSRTQIAANAKQLPWATFLDRDLQVPFETAFPWKGRFDVAVSSEVIEHLDDPATLLDNARELLGDGGRLVLSTQSGPIRQTEQKVGHRRHFDQRDMTALLRAHGFEPERVWNTGFPFHDLSKWYANLDPERSMAQFGERAYGLRENLVCAALRLAFRTNSKTRGAQLFAVARTLARRG